MLAAPSRGSSCLGLVQGDIPHQSTHSAAQYSAVQCATVRMVSQHSTAQTHIPGTGWGTVWRPVPCAMCDVSSLATQQNNRGPGERVAARQVTTGAAWAPSTCVGLCVDSVSLAGDGTGGLGTLGARCHETRDHPWWCKAAGFITRDHGARANTSTGTRSRYHCRS